EVIDSSVRYHRRVVGDESSAVVQERVHCVGVVDQAARGGGRQVLVLRIGLVGQRAAQRKTLLGVPGNVVIQLANVPVLSVGERRGKAKSRIIESVTHRSIVGMR